MALLKRLSDNFWAFVSPQKQHNHTSLPTPKTDREYKHIAKSTRRKPFHDVRKKVRSMSPSERIGSGQMRQPSGDINASGAGRKRKSLSYKNQAADAGRRAKIPRVESNNVAEEPSDLDELDGDTLIEDEADVDISIAETLVVDEAEYNALAPGKDSTFSLADEHKLRNVSTVELRDQGWDDDYITLIQKIAMRGFEPLLPAYWKFDYRFLPDGLFEKHDDAFISSVRSDHFRASKAMERLFELGGRVRDRVYLDGTVAPQEQIRRQLMEYQRWADEDAGLDPRSAIPILATDFRPAHTPSAVLRANATRKCARLAARYQDALLVQRSVELPPPASHPSKASQLSHPLPTLYAIVAAHAVVAVMAYNPNDEEPEAKPMAFFDLRNVDYDVWNSLALAIVICHVRNVQVRIAEETGIGQRQSVYDEEEGPGHRDPDA